MEKELLDELDQLVISDLSITGVIRRCRADENVLEFQFTNAQGMVQTGILLVHRDHIKAIKATGRRVWLQGLMQHEVTVTFDPDAQISIDVVLRFIRGLMDLFTEATPPLLGPPVLDPGTRAEMVRIAPRCYYAGCGGGDSWPRAT